jgi:hypothetical protein
VTRPVEVVLRLGASGGDDAVERLRAFAEKRGWYVVQVHRGESQPGARPMMALAPEAVARVVALHEAGGLTYQGIADALNVAGTRGARGGRWWPKTVQAALRQARAAGFPQGTGRKPA